MPLLMAWPRQPEQNHVVVQKTTVGVVGRIFEFVHGSGANPPVITSANLGPIVEALLQSIKDEHHIAEKVGHLAFHDQAHVYVMSQCRNEYR